MELLAGEGLLGILDSREVKSSTRMNEKDLDSSSNRTASNLSDLGEKSFMLLTLQFCYQTGLLTPSKLQHVIPATQEVGVAELQFDDSLGRS